jgi:hypothetical protein
MDRPAVLVLLNNSLGEIHFILPYLVRMKEENQADIYFYFINARIFHKAQEDRFYYDTINRCAAVLKPNDLLFFLWTNRKRVKLILKDTTPLTDKNIVFRIKDLCPQASLVLFPHAYALLGYKNDLIQQGETLAVENKNVDKVLFVHEFDAPVLAKRYDKNKLLFAGALGYSPWWSKVVEAYVRNDLQIDIKIPNDKIKVLFTLRDIHRVYLTEENFSYLLKSALDILLDTARYFVIIKPHPRQNMEMLRGVLKQYKEDNYTLSHLNTFVLSHLCDINLSFWSSSVTDSVAMGIPTIEFYRYHEPFGQTIQTDLGIQSFYSYFSLTKAVSSKDELQNELPDTRQQIQRLYEEQRVHLDQIFSGIEIGYQNFKQLVSSTRGHSVSGSMAVMKQFAYFVLKFIFRKFRPV